MPNIFAMGRLSQDTERTGARLGLRRVQWIRVTLSRDVATAEVQGVGHRLPRSVPVTLGMATSLAAAGVPLVVRRAG